MHMLCDVLVNYLKLNSNIFHVLNFSLFNISVFFLSFERWFLFNIAEILSFNTKIDSALVLVDTVYIYNIYSHT